MVIGCAGGTRLVSINPDDWVMIFSDNSVFVGSVYALGNACGEFCVSLKKMIEVDSQDVFSIKKVGPAAKFDPYFYRFVVNQVVINRLNPSEAVYYALQM